MDYKHIFTILSPEWMELKIHPIDGVPHWLGCRLILLLGLSSSTWAFRGNKLNPKMQFPLYRMEFVEEVNHKRPVYHVSIEGIMHTIKYTKKCWRLRARLRQNGIKL